MKIIDNFLSDSEFDQVFSMIADTIFPWFFATVVDGSKYSHFSHVFYNNDEPTYYYPKLIFFRKKLEIKSLVKIKANLNPRTQTLEEHDYHIDYPDVKTAILYLNTCDGYTKFKNGEKVDSVKNRIVIFDSNLEHTGTSCTNQYGRMVINFNYF